MTFPIPHMTDKEQQERKRKIPLITKSSSADQGTSLMETKSDGRETAKEERM
jgi:hypothetical protein